jgi:hypothetical protein
MEIKHDFLLESSFFSQQEEKPILNFSITELLERVLIPPHNKLDTL